MSCSITFRCTTGASMLSALLLAGCGGAPSAPPVADVHDHPTEGPHHGELVELGNEEYHAEIVHSAGAVSVFILDGSASSPVAIEATEVTINLSHDGQAEQFKLPASAEPGDAAGKSSRFTLSDPELASDLDTEGTAAKLVVSINGKSYTGKLQHEHTDGGHDHEGN